MKTSILISAITACALSAPIASAQEKLAPTKPAMNMDMGKPAQERPAPAMPAMSEDMEKQMPKMQANMEKMQQQMEKIGTTTDPKERQKLMQEHMQTMQENMKTMRGMGGPMMKGEGKPGGMMMGDKKGSMKDSDMKKRQEMTETRMDMMQMMMEQMMKRDEAMKPMPDR
jgi:hypothetical protein